MSTKSQCPLVLRYTNIRETLFQEIVMCDKYTIINLVIPLGVTSLALDLKRKIKLIS